MEKSQLIGLYDHDQRINVEYPDSRREVKGKIVRHVNEHGPEGGTIIYSKLNETDADENIREQIAYFEELGRDFEWKLYDYDTPPDLKERLIAHGFEIEEAEAIMVLAVDEAPEVLLQPVQQPIKRLTGPDQIEDVVAVEEQVWQDDQSDIGHYLAETLKHAPELMSVYVAYLADQPVSAAWIYFPKRSRFASLWGGSTLPAYRNRGLYTALLAVRVQEARQRQVSYLTVDASPMSRPILEKFGFEKIATAYPCKYQVTKQ